MFLISYYKYKHIYIKVLLINLIDFIFILFFFYFYTNHTSPVIIYLFEEVICSPSQKITLPSSMTLRLQKLLRQRKISGRSEEEGYAKRKKKNRSRGMVDSPTCVSRKNKAPRLVCSSSRVRRNARVGISKATGVYSRPCTADHNIPPPP